MPEFEVYIEDETRKEMFRYLKDTGSVVIPDLRYPTDEFTTIEDEDEFIHCIYHKTVGFFILNPAYSIYSLWVDRNEYFEKPTYSIVQRYGGPYIDISCYRGWAEDAVIKAKSTIVFHYPRYIRLQEVYEEFKAPESLKEYYKNFKKFLYSKCNRVRVDGKTYYVDKRLDPEKVI